MLEELLNSDGEDVYQVCDFARFYDWSLAEYDSDIPFYLDLTKQTGFPILEVACGTGRLSIPLARHGLRTVGIDFSDHMLDIARAKLRHEPERVRELITFLCEDMRSFDLNEAFRAVLVPNASVFHLPDVESVSNCFSCLHNHTMPGGTVVVDVVSHYLMANQEVGKQILAREGINPSTGLMTRELNKKLLIDHDNQIVRVQHIYVEQAGSAEKRYAFVQDYRWLEKDEGFDLLHSAGFAEVKALGSYDRSPYSIDSSRLILVGTRSSREGDQKDGSYI
jgi:SAM-dependent methyltransferase